MNLKNQAQSLTSAQRRQIISEYNETELYKPLRELLQAMRPNYTVEITHGPNEFGKDLVMVRIDDLTKDVIAIVVKCGKITGNTRGKVDEIRSQVEQALLHPVEMKSVYEELPVSKVLVMVAGQFSKSGRKRLRSELTVDIEIFDINWLADKFTEFYPEFFFEGEVMDFLQKKTSELEEKHRRDKDGSNLSDFFVNPLIRPLGTPFEFDEKGLRTLFEKRKYSFSRLLEITKKRDKLILLGDPGTGKTGATAKLAIDMYRDAYNQLLLKPGKNTQEIPIPVHVSARNFIEAESLDRFLTNYFNSAETRKHFKIDLIIVDGLDEIESEKRETFMDKLDEFSEEVGSSYILTSRKIDFLTTLSEKYEKYELLPFEFNQAVEFISNLISDSNTLDYMKDRLDKIKMQLFLVPLSLMLLVDLVEEKKEVPASLTELYDRFFDMVFGREAQDKGIEVLFDYVIKKRFLGELAYHEYLCNNKFELSDKDFRQFLDSYMQKYGLEIDNVNHFIREIERAGIIDIKDNVIFKHRSYLDYFAAFHIHENRETFENLNDFIVDIYFNEIWSEVAFFYIGLHRNISQDLIEKISTLR